MDVEVAIDVEVGLEVDGTVVVEDGLVDVCELAPVPQADNATTIAARNGALFDARGLTS